MASKNKKQRQNATAGGLCQEVERLMAKDRLKDAVKQAKLCYKEESTPEHHRLLERAYFLRAEQLRKNGMPTEGREVARHLLDFGITDPALVEAAAGLLMAVGMAKDALKLQGRIGTPEARERLTRQAADQAVLHPERVADVPPEVRTEALRVRAALQALGAGDEEKASAALRDVARNSPFADWKLFVRGLAAYFRLQDDEARANWERLDARRAAARIARTLLALTGPATAAADGRGAGVNLDALEKSVFGEPVFGPLEQLRALVAEGRWSDAVRRLTALRFRLRPIDPKLVERLTRVLYFPLIRAASDLDYREAKALIGEFTRGAEPLPIDPRWNRLWALTWEGPQGGIDEAEQYWRAYLKDLETVPTLAPEERTLAQALVLKHLGEFYLAEAADFAEGPFGSGRIDREFKDLRQQAVACLEESLRLAPTHRATYHELRDAYRKWDQPAQALEVARRLLERFPDDFETWVYLAEHHFRRDEGVEALEATLRARKLRPLDQTLAHHEWGVRVMLARQLALQGRFEEGRAEFAAAERADPTRSQGLPFLARKAVFELKAGQPGQAESLIADAQHLLVEPTPLWLALSIEAVRYQLAKADRDRFEARWINSVSLRPRSETAGALADLMGAFVAIDKDYAGRAGHLKQVADYLRRTTRIKYRLEDLIHVCAFLGLLPKERDLFEKMVKRGLKLFPESPNVLILAGSLELEKGPFRGGNLMLARKHFEKALERAKASSDPNDVKLVPKIQESLSQLADLTSGPMGLPFGPFGGFGGGGANFFDTIRNLVGMGFDDLSDEDDFDDDDDDDDYEERPPRPAPAPGRAKGGGKRKKK